ncbi:MAG: hypothetical protein ACRD5F_01615 [Candidatus Acidiferrales bacterium]
MEIPILAFASAMLCSVVAARMYVNVLLETDPDLHELFPAISLVVYALNPGEVMQEHRKIFPQSGQRLWLKLYSVLALAFWFLALYLR